MMKCFILSLLLFATLLGNESPHDDPCDGPWFTGPLLAPAGGVVPEGYINVEPYTFYNVNTALYNNDWKVVNAPDFTSVEYQFLLYVGLTPWMDIFLIPAAEWRSTQGVSSMTIADFMVELDFQAYQHPTNIAIPTLKLSISETFPIGKFQRGNPQKLLTDLGGEGTFETILGATSSSTIEYAYCRYLNLRINTYFSYLTNVNVRGLNAYGGAPNTKGTIRPGLEWGWIFAMQLSLTRNWAFAMDIEGAYAAKTKFRGFPGNVLGQPPPILSIPRSVSYSIAPAIQYNFNEKLGIIGGVWFSLAGKNTPRFISGIVAVNYITEIGPKKKPAIHPHLGGSGRSR